MEDEPKQEAKQEKKADTKVSAKLDKLMGEIESLTVLELADLVKALEEKFGVTAIAAAPAAASNGAGAPAKAVRELVPTLSLLDAKKLVESLPKDVLTGVNKKDAEEAQKKLAAAGAQVELK